MSDVLKEKLDYGFKLCHECYDLLLKNRGKFNPGELKTHLKEINKSEKVFRDRIKEEYNIK